MSQVMRYAPLVLLWAVGSSGCLPDSAEGGEPDAADLAADAGADAAVVVDAEVPAEPGELRGVWITRFAYDSAESLEGIIDRAAAANFNAVFVQVRGNGDAYYESSLEPWAQNLSGVLGRDPGWDPLQVAVDRAREHGIEIHAYFNALAAWPASLAPVPQAEGEVQHALYDNPEWLAVDSSESNSDPEYLYFTPGNPEVRAHLAAVAADLVSRYEVDGLHLDRIRTPGPDYSRDAVTVAAYEEAAAEDPDLTWADFMREQVNLVVDEIHEAITEARPEVRHSAAVWGIYQKLDGCGTSEGYDGFYQDSLAWLERGSMDALVPMIYWSLEPGSCTDWAAHLDVFLAGASGRHIWGGMHALDRVDGESVWDFDAVRARIDHARGADAPGVVVFASSYLDADLSRWEAFLGTDEDPGPYYEPIDPPAMPWKPAP